MADAPTAVDRALRDLARTIETAAPSAQLATAVLERVAAEPVPARSGIRIAVGRWGDWLRARLRWVIGAAGWRWSSPVSWSRRSVPRSRSGSASTASR